MRLWLWENLKYKQNNFFNWWTKKVLNLLFVAITTANTFRVKIAKTVSDFIFNVFCLALRYLCQFCLIGKIFFGYFLLARKQFKCFVFRTFMTIPRKFFPVMLSLQRKLCLKWNILYVYFNIAKKYNGINPMNSVHTQKIINIHEFSTFTNILCTFMSSRKMFSFLYIFKGK